MTALTMNRSSLWSIDSRVIVYSAIGAALYGILVSAQLPVPGTTAVSIRPAFALVPFFGYAFGPIVGFFTGLVGNMIGDQISGWGALTSYNWSLANGVVGLLAGLGPLYIGRWVAGSSFANRATAAAVAGAIAVVIGFLLAFYDMIKDQLDFNAVLTTEYLPVVIVDVITTAVLVPALLYVWLPTAERTGR